MFDKFLFLFFQNGEPKLSVFSFTFVSLSPSFFLIFLKTLLFLYRLYKFQLPDTKKLWKGTILTNRIFSATIGL